MSNRLASLVCIFALACMCVGCTAGYQAGTVPGAPENPASDPSATLQITTTQLPDASGNSPYSAQLSAEGGAPPYIWSATSALPAGLTISSSGVIAGTTAESGLSTLAVKVQDSEPTPQVAETTLAIRTANAIETSAQPASPTTNFYGAGRGADGLANVTLGPHGYTVSYRFVAEHASYLDKIRFYIIPDKAGYAAGNGGELQISVQSDDGTSAHNPSGTVLSSVVLSNPLAATGKARYFPVIAFSVPAYLSAGKIYHIVFKNVDSSPTLNYLSVDDFWYSKPNSPTQPTVSNAASAVLLRWSGASWEQLKAYSPIMELIYSNGDYQGYGYVEALPMAPEVISGTHAVREAFTVTGASKTVYTVGMRLDRISGSDNLTVRLENSDGSLIEQGYLSPSSFPVASYVWATYTFSTAHTLLAGHAYHLVLESPSTTEYAAYPIEKGWMYGFDKATYFPDGYAQLDTGSGWAGWTLWGSANVTYTDLQFYFGL